MLKVLITQNGELRLNRKVYIEIPALILIENGVFFEK